MMIWWCDMMWRYDWVSYKWLELWIWPFDLFSSLCSVFSWISFAWEYRIVRFRLDIPNSSSQYHAVAASAIETCWNVEQRRSKFAPQRCDRTDQQSHRTYLQALSWHRVRKMQQTCPRSFLRPSGHLVIAAANGQAKNQALWLCYNSHRSCRIMTYFASKGPSVLLRPKVTWQPPVSTSNKRAKPSTDEVSSALPSGEKTWRNGHIDTQIQHDRVG